MEKTCNYFSKWKKDNANRVWILSFPSFSITHWISSFSFGFCVNLDVISRRVLNWSSWLVSSCCGVRALFVFWEGQVFRVITRCDAKSKAEALSPCSRLSPCRSECLSQSRQQPTLLHVLPELFRRVTGSASPTAANARRAAAGASWESPVSLRESGVRPDMIKRYHRATDPPWARLFTLKITQE